MPPPMQVFVYAVLLQATEEEPAELYSSLGTILAETLPDAETAAARAIPEQFADRAEVIVRPF